MDSHGSQRDQQRVLNLLTYAWQRLDEHLDLDLLAERAGLSPFHFHRVFHRVTGEAPHTHLRRLRLERAAMALRYGGAHILDVALAVGYDSREGFTRAFTEHFGESPAAYRVRAQEALLRVQASRRVQQAAVPVSIGSFPTTRVAFWRHYGPIAERDEACLELGRWAEPRGLLRPDVPYLGLNYDDHWITSPQHLRFDACLAVPADFIGDGLIGVQEVPGGTFAIGQYEGDPRGLIPAWKWLTCCWFPGSGWHIAGQCALELRSASTLPISRTELMARKNHRLRCELYLPVSRTMLPQFPI